MSDKIFPTGLFVDRPNENAPDYVKAKLSIKVEDFISFLQQHKSARGYVNLDMLNSQSDKLYCVLNEWKKPEGLSGEQAEGVRKLREEAQREQEQPGRAESEGINPDDIPF